MGTHAVEYALSMNRVELLRAEDIDVPFHWPPGIQGIVAQTLVDPTPWHVMRRDLAQRRLHGLR